MSTSLAAARPMLQAIAIVVMVVGMASVTSSGRAQQAADAADYDEIVRTAVEAFGAKNFPRAMALFEQAHVMDPSARTLRGMGMVAFEMRRFERAYGYLTAALDDPRKRLGDRHRKHVRDLIARTRAFVGVFRLSIEPAGATLTIDGEAPDHARNGELWLDVGRHVVEARAPGHQPLTMQLEVVGNEDQPLRIALVRGGDGSEAAGGATAASVAPEVATPSHTSLAGPPPDHATTASIDETTPWMPIGLVIAGGVMAASSVVTGLMTRQTADDLDSLCGSARRCQPDDASEARQLQSDGDALALVTDVLLFGGLAVGGAGILWWTLGVQADEESSGTDAVSLVCAPGVCAVRARGSF